MITSFLREKKSEFFQQIAEFSIHLDNSHQDQSRLGRNKEISSYFMFIRGRRKIIRDDDDDRS